MTGWGGSSFIVTGGSKRMIQKRRQSLARARAARHPSSVDDDPSTPTEETRPSLSEDASSDATRREALMLKLEQRIQRQQLIIDELERQIKRLKEQVAASDECLKKEVKAYIEQHIELVDIRRKFTRQAFEVRDIDFRRRVFRACGIITEDTGEGAAEEQRYLVSLAKWFDDRRSVINKQLERRHCSYSALVYKTLKMFRKAELEEQLDKFREIVGLSIPSKSKLRNNKERQDIIMEAMLVVGKDSGYM